VDRRGFIKALGFAGSSILVPSALRGDETPTGEGDSYGVLVDTTECGGCRSCEVACAEANGLPEPDLDDESVFEAVRKTSPTQYTVVNAFQTDVGEVTVKRQCLHCDQPACASACLTKAMYKTKEGPVIWRGNKCMGCRFCMLSCPADVPKFEYHSANPRILKCSMCYSRLAKGEKPACVENCPAEALTFGKREDLIREAYGRIQNNPDTYYPHVYGHQEAGGTSWLYLSPVPFDQIGFRTDLESKPYPELTKGFLYSVPIVILLWPAFLLALNNATKGSGGQPAEVSLS
jgi:Fe-S-cluster-containing dehydrogenase component